VIDRWIDSVASATPSLVAVDELRDDLPGRARHTAGTEATTRPTAGEGEAAIHA